MFGLTATEFISALALAGSTVSAVSQADASRRASNTANDRAAANASQQLWCSVAAPDDFIVRALAPSARISATD